MKKIIIGLATFLLIGVGLTGCGAKEEAKEEKKVAAGEVLVEKENYMKMGKNNKAVFEIDGSEVSINLKMAERTSDRTAGAPEAKEVIIMTYQYDVVSGNKIKVDMGRFRVTDKSGKELEVYPGYRDYLPKEIGQGENCRAQMVWKNTEEMQEVIVELLDKDKKEAIGKWTLPIDKRNYY